MTVAADSWSPLRRIAFRFAFVLLGMSALKMLACFFPIHTLSVPYWFVWRRLLDWLSPLVLHVEPVGTLEGSDSLAAWLLQLWTLIFAVLAALAWTWRAKATDYRRLLDAHRTVVRYSLSCALLVYGLDKLFCVQFWRPTPVDLVQTFAGSSPFGLMWRFMGFSSPYQFFGGVLETVGALLLFWRRTTTLGAVMLAGVLLNVVVLNFCYQIPVKNFSSEFLLQASWLLLPQLGRLAGVLLARDPPKAAPVRPYPWPRRFERARVIVKAVSLVTLVVLIAIHIAGLAKRRGRHSSLWGAYDVEAFTVDGADTGGPRAWERVAFGANWGPAAAIVTGDGTYRLFSAKHDEAQRTIALVDWDLDDEDAKPMTLHVQLVDETHLELDGQFEGAAVRARLRLHDFSNAPMNRRLTWVDDGGYYR
jgi:uncharacterized membrane protein YphA (DoxX/SURF4 family)